MYLIRKLKIPRQIKAEFLNKLFNPVGLGHVSQARLVGALFADQGDTAVLSDSKSATIWDVLSMVSYDKGYKNSPIICLLFDYLPISQLFAYR